MAAAENADWSGETRRAKLVILFCALGFAMFLLDLAAGVWLWTYSRSYANELPTYDRFLADMRAANPQGLAEIAFVAHAGWEACEKARAGIQETVVHMTMAASFVGLVLFSLCFGLSYQVYRALLRLPGGAPAPLEPDDVDGTWR